MRTLFLLFFSLVLSLALLRLFQLWFYFWGRRALLERGPQGRAPRTRFWAGVFCAGIPLCLALFGRPVSGLVGLVLMPFLLLVAGRVSAGNHRRNLDDSGLAYFHALRGLVHSGLGLSSALFRLAQAQRTPFALAMAKSLDAFDDGKTLAACLERFHRRVPSPLMGATLRSLQMAYHQGLPVAPILDQMVPVLEAEREMARRLVDLRRSALAQAAIAFGVPWVLVGAFLVFRPEGGMDWFATSNGVGVLLVALSAEVLGVWGICRCSTFY